MVPMGKVVAGRDPLAVDVASLELASSLGYGDFVVGKRNKYVTIAAELGVGDGDTQSVRAKTIQIAAGETPKTCPTSEPGLSVPQWLPYASLFLFSLGLGLAGMIRDRRRRQDGG